MPLRIDLLLVGAEGADFLFGEEFQLGDADPVFTGNHAIQAARQVHDALDGLVCRLQHVVVVGIDRDVGVHVAIAGVHVQGDEDAAAQHFLVDGLNALDDRPVHRTVENLGQARLQLLLPGGAHGIVLQPVEEARIGRLVGQFTSDDAVGSKTRFSFG